jgi:hypothetical protein
MPKTSSTKKSSNTVQRSDSATTAAETMTNEPPKRDEYVKLIDDNIKFLEGLRAERIAKVASKPAAAEPITDDVTNNWDYLLETIQKERADHIAGLSGLSKPERAAKEVAKLVRDFKNTRGAEMEISPIVLYRRLRQEGKLDRETAEALIDVEEDGAAIIFRLSTWKGNRNDCPDGIEDLDLTEAEHTLLLAILKIVGKVRVTYPEPEWWPETERDDIAEIIFADVPKAE